MDQRLVLFRLTDSLFRAESHTQIFDAGLDAITSVLSARTSILLFDDEGVMRFVAWRGLSEGYRNRLSGHSPWKPGSRAAEPILVEDVQASGEPGWVKNTILAEGIRGLAFIPLFARGTVIGKFMIYYPKPHIFSKDEEELAVTIARQLGFALERARAEGARRQAVEQLRESEERFRVLSEEAPVMIWMSDTVGRCQHLNRMLRNFWGVSENDVVNFDWRTTMHPDDEQRIVGAMGQALQQAQAVQIDGRYRDALGEYRVLRTDARPRFSPGGRFLGMIGVNVDVTEGLRAEGALREREERLRVALAAGRMGTWRYNLATGAQSWDARQYELFGLDASAPPTRDLFLSIVHPDDRGKVDFDPESLSREGEFLDSEFRILRPDGMVRWITAHSVARCDASGRPIEMIGVNFDITGQKEAEQRLQLVLDELNHRVKNMLAVVQSLAHQTFRDNSEAGPALSAFEGRLLALAGAQNLLTQSNWEDAPLGKIALNTLRSQGIEQQRFSLRGPSIELSAKQAMALAMALHELSTNAVKYGALSNDVGVIELDWERTHGEVPAFRLNWTERGGPPVRPPERRGFGSRLVEQLLARDLQGAVKLEFNPSGVFCSIAAPLGSPTKAVQ